ncbi:hypothetical protein [Massilia sp. CF038]|uniref:hypothetical protein n=1 Tax=Massilia sp. CF038 TaxID=1881045 RepID=UPI000922EB59|nr:hypothetical protein [Massilia sp. CF038]SHH20757.1 hypothetical protein SAMN05428948_3315 [Massilia sp. CF038]
MAQALPIFWPHAATVGHITVSSAAVHGVFPAHQGDDARIGCHLVAAGKYRNGAARAWCRSHQHYWGTKADLQALAEQGEQRCAAADCAMAYVRQPQLIDLTLRPTLPQASAALALRYDHRSGLFANADIVQVNLTPPAVTALLDAMAQGRQLGCVDCRHCGHPHLDLGSFAERPHRRHTCGNCGHDATHSSSDIVSNPLFPLLQYYGVAMQAALSTVQRFLVL